MKPGFHMIATIAAIVVVIWKPLCSDRWDRNFSISAIVIAAVAGKWFPYDHYDRSDRWTFFFSDRSDCSDHMGTRLKWTTFYHVLSLQKFPSIDKSVKLTGLLMSIRPTFFCYETKSRNAKASTKQQNQQQQKQLYWSTKFSPLNSALPWSHALQ